MKKTSRITALFLSFWMMLQLTGCTSFLRVEDLLTPPQLEGDQQEIYNALQKSVSGEITLSYPQSGEYKSAITMLNIDDEPTEEAIAFYESTSVQIGGSVTMPLRLNVLDYKDGRWTSVYDMGIEADQVEKLQLVTVQDATYLVVGYSFAASGGKLVEIYRFLYNVLAVTGEFRALNYEIVDLNQDGSDEILKIYSVDEFNEEGESVQSHPEAQLIEMTPDGYQEVNSVRLYPSVTEYAAIQVGTLSDGTTAVFLDGVIGSQLISEILICNQKGRLKHLLYDGSEESVQQVTITQRSLGIYTTDVEDDGSYEIPRIIPAPGYEGKERYEQLSFTLWYNYNASGSQRRFLSYVDYSLGYIFRIPSNWEERVTAEKSVVDNEITFYEYDRLTETRGSAILSLRVMSRSDYISQDISGKYELLMTNGQLVFLFYGHNSMSKLSMEKEVVKDSLYLLS